MTTTEILKFEKLKKKFALNNSYFKNRQYNSPSNPFEVLEYYKVYNELPYENGTITDNWFYDCFIEYQKRAGVYNSQFFTPTNTAKRMVEILSMFADTSDSVLDACCGFGQITKELYAENYTQISAFDIDKKMIDACELLYDYDIDFYKDDFKEPKICNRWKFKYIISNPPYEIKDLTIFFEWLNETLSEGGKAVLLIPAGFLDKQRPSNLVKVLNNFFIESREPMTEKFDRTGVVAEIVVLSK